MGVNEWWFRVQKHSVCKGEIDGFLSGSRYTVFPLLERTPLIERATLIVRPPTDPAKHRPNSPDSTAPLTVWPPVFALGSALQRRLKRLAQPLWWRIYAEERGARHVSKAVCDNRLHVLSVHTG